MHFPNRLLFFGRWNTLCLSCRNDLHFKESNLTFFLNGQAKSLKLTVNRETLFHCMNKTPNPIDPTSFSFSPCIAVHFLLNKLVICRGFRGKLSRVLVFKGDMKELDLQALDIKLGVLSDLDSVRSHKLLQEWMKERYFAGKLIFDLSAFDFRGHRDTFFGAIVPILEDILIGQSGLCKIGEKLGHHSQATGSGADQPADQNDERVDFWMDQDQHGIAEKKHELMDRSSSVSPQEAILEEQMELLRRYSVQITDAASFADIHFSPIYCGESSNPRPRSKTTRQSSFFLDSNQIKYIQEQTRLTNLSEFSDKISKFPDLLNPHSQDDTDAFSFEFDLCSNDPFHFDYSLLQQNFFEPLLTALPQIASFEDPERGQLLEIWAKALTNFITKPKLCSHFGPEYLQNQIVHRLLAALVTCASKHPHFALFPPKVCDIFLDTLNSLDLPVAGALINGLLLNRCFLFELARTPAHLTYALSKAAVWLFKYRNLRKILDWQLLLDNIVFFLSISDFSASKSRGAAHFNLSAQLATFFLLFFPFAAGQNESLLLFHRQLGLDTQFALFGLLFSSPPPPPSCQQIWPNARFDAVSRLLHSLPSSTSNPSQPPILLNLKMVLFSLSSPLLSKSLAKTGLLLDLLFLLIERHAILPTQPAPSSYIVNPFSGPLPDDSQFNPKAHFALTFKSLFFDFKNNSSRVLIRSLALLIKSGHSFELLPPSFFCLRKFLVRSSSRPTFLPLHEFLSDQSLILSNSTALVEYLFSVFFQHYSLSGFFDHERLSLADPRALTAFLGLTRYLETASIEKSLQIFSILLQHSTKLHFFPFFSHSNALCAFADLLFRFSPLPQNSLFLKLKLYQTVKEWRDTDPDPNTSTDSPAPSPQLINQPPISQTLNTEPPPSSRRKSVSLLSLNKSEVLKAHDISDLLLYFSSLQVNVIPLLQHRPPKPAVFDLSLRIVRLLQNTCLDSLRDILSFAFHVSFFSSYFQALDSPFLQTRVLSASLSQLCACLPLYKLEEPLVFALFVCQQSLTSINCAFYMNQAFLPPSLATHLDTVSKFLQLFSACTVSRFSPDSAEIWFRKIKFKFMGPDRRFPVDLASTLKSAEFSFLHLLVGSGQIKVPSNQKSRHKDSGGETALEAVFLLSHILVEVVTHFENLFRNVKRLIPDKKHLLAEPMDIKLLEVLDVLAQHFQLVLLLTRHNNIKKKRVKWMPVFEQLVVRLFKLIIKIFSHVGMSQHINTNPTIIISITPLCSITSLSLY